MCCEKHPTQDLYIYGYYGNRNASYWNDVSIDCRGLILNGDGYLIERPFPKFWTFRQYLSSSTVLLSENIIQTIPDCPFKILEKVDGTMVTLYWIDNEPYFATQRSFSNPKVLIAKEILHEKYAHLLPKLDKKCTYVFEALYPETKVLIDYGERRDLVLLSVINKETGENLPIENRGFPTCKDYTQEYGHIKRLDELANINLPNQEGFVILYETGLRIKVKFPWYQKVHSLLDDMFYNAKQMSIKQREVLKILNGHIGEVTGLMVWEALRRKQTPLQSLREKLTTLHFMNGIEYWLNQESKEFTAAYKQCESSNPNLSEDEIWERIKPKTFNRFSLEYRMEESHIYDTVIWNWEKQYLHKFL
jgi:hypothetical protein